ncbi:MAG: PKD domain-containing protein [Nitrospirae bacterium]|nr:PKD domain-containing protein [Nitrospirota bacterium]
MDSAPVADAGHNQVVSVGATVTLDGSASHDADNQPLTYHWSLITKPVNSQATLSDPMNVRPTFVVDVAGEYVAQLIVNDGKQDSRPATVMVRTFTVPTKRGIHISRARWQSDTVILSVSGRGPKNAVVDIIDAVSGAPIGTVTASDTGRFRFQATVTTSPCAVEVKSGQLVSHKALVRGTGDLCKTQFPPKQPRAEKGTTTRSSQNLERERGQ